MNIKSIILILSLSFIAACDTLNHQQYFIISSISPTEVVVLKNEIKTALIPVVKKYGLEETTNISPKINAILAYNTKSNFPIQVGIRNVNDVIVLELMHFHPGTGETEEYKKILSDIEIALQEISTLRVVKNGNIIKL
jgi:hypothetical protein